MPDLIAIVLFIIILIIGIFFLIFGLISFKEKRLIENIPTSNIRSIAMGLVEIFGRVVPIEYNILKSPFSDKDCVYYKYRVEELRSSGKNTHWVTVDKGERHSLFNLEDETGSVLINPKGAKIDIPIDNKYNSSLGTDPPEAAKRFLASRNIRWEGFIFGINKTMRYSEYFIAPGDNLYIIGTADDNPYVKEASAEKGVEDIMIKKGKFEKFYYISDKQEDAVLFKFTAKTYGGIIIGSFLILLSLLVFNWF
ncbi:hypothetical protein AYK24_00765 [Thermoplasmatales archaeon SG8-52-4]|nr:MAG: hypothetical protein AYK24_00765 [Thermoplasmatales archaeon SG8-52-4]